MSGRELVTRLIASIIRDAFSVHASGSHRPANPAAGAKATNTPAPTIEPVDVPSGQPEA